MRLADLRHGPLVEGNGASSVRVIAYEDLQCSDCATYRRMLDETLLPSYRDSVAFEHREYPLPKHAWARTAAIAACYFDELKPEIGVAFRRYCFAKQHEIQPHEFEDRVREFAESHGIDPAGATAALDDPTLSQGRRRAVPGRRRPRRHANSHGIRQRPAIHRDVRVSKIFRKP